MNTYIVAKKEERIYAKTSFSSFRLQPVEYSGTSSNGFYQINSLTFTDKDNRILPITDIKEESANKATFVLDGKITGTVTYNSSVYGDSNGVGKLLKTSGWFYPTQLNTLTDKPSIEFTFSNIIPRLSKITWTPYNASSKILKINFLADLELLDIDTTTKNEINFNYLPSILDLYKNRPVR